MIEQKTKKLIEQLEILLNQHDVLRNIAELSDLCDLPIDERQNLVTRSLAAINRIAGPNSIYSHEVGRILESNPRLHSHTHYILGIVAALRDDLRDGYVNTLVELVHADIFADFLDMAYHLQEAGFKDAAAVITGSTLESHIKKICSKYSIDVENDGKPIKTEKLNADLVKSEAYGKLDQKNITAWLDLRNKAAHGKYSEYTSDQVELLISGVRDFIGRVPA